MPPSHSVRARLFPLLVVVVAVLLVPAIAFANSSDPGWLEGTYNDADGDDLLSLVDDIVATEAACLSNMSPPPHFFRAAFTLRPSMTAFRPANRFTRGPPLRPAYGSTPRVHASPTRPALHLPRPPRTTRVDNSQKQAPPTAVPFRDPSNRLPSCRAFRSPEFTSRNNSPLHRTERRCGQTQSSSLRGGCHGQEDESRY